MPSSLAHLLLGPAGRQRLRASQTLLALVVYAVFAAVQHGEVLLGLLDVDDSNRLSLYNLAGAAVFYGLIRSGWNERFTSDPSLTMAQSLFAISCITWSYAITGPARGAVMVILVLVIVFGVFALSPRQARALGAVGFGALSAVMLWKGLTDPLRYDPRVELVHVFFAGVVVASVSALSIRLGRMNRRLSEQKAELAQALERIRLLATRDDLTGLLNRRAMSEVLVVEARRSARTRSPLSMVLIDLDHFKRINDEHGHQTGDRVLRAFADIARAELRDADVLSRWGGEEFLLLLPDTSAAAGRASVERIRTALQARGFDDVAPGFFVGFSAGLSDCAGESDVEPCIERADQAMYRAKTRGRNRSEVHGDPAQLHAIGAAPSANRQLGT